MFVALGWKSLPGTNTSTLQKLVNYGQKSFITLGPDSPTNGGLGFRGLARTNITALYKRRKITDMKSFRTLAPNAISGSSVIGDLGKGRQVAKTHAENALRNRSRKRTINLRG